jgi:hypothetical protein
MKYSILTLVALAFVVSAGAAMAQTAVMSTDLSATAVASQPIATVGGDTGAVRVHMLPQLPAQAPFDFPPIGGPGGMIAR